MSYIIKYIMKMLSYLNIYSFPDISYLVHQGGEQIYLPLDEEFIIELIELGGTPQEVVDNEEFLQLFTPILRNDFKMLEKYFNKEKKDKIQCDISILDGKEDDITIEEILA